MCEQNKRHVHYDVIVAWAEGKPVQRKTPLGNDWHDDAPNRAPEFSPNWGYRIKPEPRSAFQIYAEAAYPKYKEFWSPRAQKPIEVGLAAVINAVKSGELK